MTKLLKVLTMALCLTIFTLLSPWPYAQNAFSEESKWEFVVIPYFWMESLNGDVTVKGIKSHVDTPFRDVLKNLDFGGEIHMEAWKGADIYVSALTQAGMAPVNTAMGAITDPVGTVIGVGSGIGRFFHNVSSSVTGTIDPIARKELEDRGWKVKDKFEDQVFMKMGH